MRGGGAVIKFVVIAKSVQGPEEQEASPCPLCERERAVLVALLASRQGSRPSE